MMKESFLLYCMISFFCGINAGSSMTCLGERTAEGKSWFRGRSRCDFCHHILHAGDLIPVVSFLLNHGRCRYCGKRLSVRYLWTEIMTGILFVLIFAGEQVFDFNVFLKWCICSILLALSITDLDSYLIPNSYIVFLTALWGVNLLQEELCGRINGYRILNDFAGALVPSAGMFFLSLIMDRFLKKESMGGGDIRLLFVLGLLTGFPLCLVLLISSSMIGLIMALIMKKEKIPFGPCISIGMIIVMLYGNEILSGYLRLLA